MAQAVYDYDCYDAESTCWELCAAIGNEYVRFCVGVLDAQLGVIADIAGICYIYSFRDNQERV